MELADGMVCVVRGMKEAGLCVTLLDGAKQYTLLSNSAAAVQQDVTRPSVQCQKSAPQPVHDRLQCDSSVQAVDGRYASSYKTAYCHVQPTSPAPLLTEFPPQRAELCPGHGNFAVGGPGSGEHSHSPTRVSGNFRGGMNWSDRGSVCNARPSREPDAFANSLRKYPSLSPERSAEIVERMVNYTQNKNSNSRNPKSPPSARSETFTLNCEKQSLNSTRTRYEPEVKCNQSPEESPTRDTRREEWEGKRGFGRSYDVRYVRDIARRAHEGIRSFSTYPYSHPVCPTITERYDHLPPQQKHQSRSNATNLVNMETQADVAMVSKEVTTLPRVKPPTRSIAVPLTPTSSKSDAKPEHMETKCLSKSIQTASSLDLTLKIRKSVQTCFSSVDILGSKKIKSKRKSKSQEELRVDDDFEEEIVQLIQDLTSCPDFDRENVLRIKLLRKLRKLHKMNRSERVKIQIGRCIKDQLYSEIDLRNFTRELSNELISKFKRHNVFIGSNPINVYRADVHPCRINAEENVVNDVIKVWLDNIPIKSIDNQGRDIKNGPLLQTIADKMRTLILNKFKYNSNSTMKADILELIKDVPIDTNGHNKRFYLNRLISELIQNLKNIFAESNTRKRWWTSTELSCHYIQPTEKELKQFVRTEILEFTEKFRLKIRSETLKQIEVELIGLLLDSMEIIGHGIIDDVKEDILVILANYVNISEQQAIYFANNVIHNLKDIYDQSCCGNKPRSQTFIVLQNSYDKQGTTNNTADYSIVGINEEDIQKNLDFYTDQLVHQINEWSVNIHGFADIDSSFRHVIVNDLADDIVDRHKYLELNQSSKSTDEDELEHLKYQIFKWMNKVMGEDNLDTIAHASELMKRIKSLPVPMLTKPHNVNSTPSNQIANIGNGLKEDTIKKTSNGRRISSPDPMTEKSIDASVMANCCKQTMNQNRRQSSPAGVSIPENYLQNNPTKNKNIESGMKDALSTAFDPTHTPQGYSVSMMDPLRDGISDRRMSEPAGFPSIAKKVSNNQISRNSVEMPSTSRFGSPTRTNKVSCCTNTSCNSTPTVEKLNDDYDEFVKNWVQEIPIATSSPKEQALAEKARLGLYNGIWKAITKLKMDPATMNNPFYYQDIFDDELEDLLGCLPQTQELASNKNILKAKLLEKTTETNELILATASPSSFKQKLIENISNHLPRNKIDYTGKDVAKLYEEMQKMNLAEDFILYIKYREEDKVKANVFKKKLMREAQNLINGIKAIHGKELKDIDAASYIDEIMIAMQKVPLPSDDTIAAEVNEIGIGLEIEQWFSDLPLVPNDNYVEKLGRRSYKDALAKKIRDIEKQKPLSDCEELVKVEVRRFLERMPLRAGETDNISFMVEELVNRLKNRTNDIQSAGGGRRKSVAFLEAYDYNEFSRDMPMCSSFAVNGRTAQANQSSYVIADGKRVDLPYEKYVQNRDVTLDSQQQWYTLEETKLSPEMFPDTSPNLPPCCKGQMGAPNSVSQFQNAVSTSSETPAPEYRDPGPSDSRFHYKSSNYEEPHFDQNMQGTRNQRFEQRPRMSGVDLNAECATACKANQTGPPSYRPEGATRPLSSHEPRELNGNNNPRVTIPSDRFRCNSLGHSTNQDKSVSSKPQRRSIEVENLRKAARRLDFDDTENESEEEIRCRCMERVWRCRRRKPVCPSCDDDFVPCFLRHPSHPYFF